MQGYQHTKLQVEVFGPAGLRARQLAKQEPMRVVEIRMRLFTDARAPAAQPMPGEAAGSAAPAAAAAPCDFRATGQGDAAQDLSIDRGGSKCYLGGAADSFASCHRWVGYPAQG